MGVLLLGLFAVFVLGFLSGFWLLQEYIENGSFGITYENGKRRLTRLRKET